MSSTYDSGHAKNVANLSKFYQLLVTFGPTYNPSNPAITSTSLNALHASAEAKLTAVNTALANWKYQTNTREIAFDDLDTFVTKLSGALQSYQVPYQTLDDFSALVKKMRGSGKLTKADAGIANPADPASSESTGNSVSQRSFDSKVQHFEKMILLLESLPAYSPNENYFTVERLKIRLAALINLNETINTCLATLKAARIERNKFFYGEGTGLLDVMKQAKAYVKSIYGAASQQYKAAKAIPFYRVLSANKAS